jgi:hypothetical protein
MSNVDQGYSYPHVPDELSSSDRRRGDWQLNNWQSENKSNLDIYLFCKETTGLTENLKNEKY